MEWFLGKISYRQTDDHGNTLLTQINNSIGLVNTFFRERESPLEISDVPYVTSEQAEI